MSTGVPVSCRRRPASRQAWPPTCLPVLAALPVRLPPGVVAELPQNELCRRLASRRVWRTTCIPVLTASPAGLPPGVVADLHENSLPRRLGCQQARSRTCLLVLAAFLVWLPPGVVADLPQTGLPRRLGCHQTWSPTCHKAWLHCRLGCRRLACRRSHVTLIEHFFNARGVGKKRGVAALDEYALSPAPKRCFIDSDDNELRPAVETTAQGPSGCVDATVRAPAPGTAVVLWLSGLLGQAGPR